MKYLKEYGLLVLIIILLIALLIIYYLRGDNTKIVNVNIVPTMITKLEDNSTWCPTFQIIWNDMKNEVIKKDIEFINDKDNQTVFDLNKETFKSTMLSDEYYYKKYGFATISMRDEIKKAIKDKFNEESDILDKFTFEKESQDYFFYSMLVRSFTFNKPFDILDDDNFGINKDSSSELYNNVKILYYKDSEHYAISLLTTSNDEVILYRGERLDNFDSIYKEIVKNTDKKVKEFNSSDTLTVANLDFKTESNYEDLTKKEFFDIDGQSYMIDQIIQSIKFKLDNTGGKVKSEAGMMMKETAFFDAEARHFNFSDDFVLFLKESNKDLPYLAVNINNIDNFR